MKGKLKNKNKLECYRCGNHFYTHYHEIKDTLSGNKVRICTDCGNKITKFLKNED